MALKKVDLERFLGDEKREEKTDFSIDGIQEIATRRTKRLNDKTLIQ